MPFKKRIEFMSFVENQDVIEESWDKTFGDRKNEIVFIGQNMDEEKIREELDSCLSTDNELATLRWKLGYDDEWYNIQRAYALE